MADAVVNEKHVRKLVREELKRLSEDRYSDEVVGYRQGEKIDPRKLHVGKVVTNPKGARGEVQQKHVDAFKKRLERAAERGGGAGNIPGSITYSGDGNGKWALKSAEPGNWVVEIQYRLPTAIKYTDKQIIRGDSIDEVAEKAAAWGYIKSHAGGNFYRFGGEERFSVN